VKFLPILLISILITGLVGLSNFDDAFCGRVPQKIIRKYYTDDSPEARRRHYDKVELFLTLPFIENDE